MSLLCHHLCAMRYLMYQPAMPDTASHASTRRQARTDGGGGEKESSVPELCSLESVCGAGVSLPQYCQVCLYHHIYQPFSRVGETSFAIDLNGGSGCINYSGGYCRIAVQNCSFNLFAEGNAILPFPRQCCDNTRCRFKLCRSCIWARFKNA